MDCMPFVSLAALFGLQVRLPLSVGLHRLRPTKLDLETQKSQQQHLSYLLFRPMEKGADPSSNRNEEVSVLFI